MLTPGSVATEALPAFLLPRLSWQAARQPLVSSVSNAVARHNCAPRQQQQWRATHSTATHTASFYTHQSSQRPLCSTRRTSPIASRAAFFHATARRERDHHFDTLRFVQRLQAEGFTEEQSVAMMKVLNDVIEER